MAEPKLTLTKIPHLDTLVIKQSGKNFFIAAPDSFVIDKAGFLNLIKGALTVDFISDQDLRNLAMDFLIGHQCTCERPSLPIGGECCELCKGYVSSERRTI